MTLKKISFGVMALLLAACGILSACGRNTETTTPEDTAFAAECQSTVESLKTLQPVEVPDNLLKDDSSKTGGEFDVNEYFTVLKHLSMEDGYVLDYVYEYQVSAGAPALYVRPADATPLKNHQEFLQATEAYTRPESDMSLVWFVMGEQTGVFGNKIKTDGTKAGYFEYTVLQLLGEQFYLFWHANYNDTRIICQAADVESAFAEVESWPGLELTDGFKQEARQLDFQPEVVISGDTVTVKLVVFTKWGGFSRFTCTMYKDYPHTVTGIEKETLLEYNSGIMF